MVRGDGTLARADEEIRVSGGGLEARPLLEAIERRAMEPNELCGIPMCPRRQHHVVNHVAVLAFAQGQPRSIGEDFGQKKHFGHELLDLSHVFVA